MTPPPRPSLAFLAESLAAALLHNYHVTRPPVPIRQFVSNPPPGVAGDVSLAESPHFTFCRALWIRPLDGQGVIFLNAGLPEPERRYELACALFSGLSASPGARAAGLHAAINNASPAEQAAYAQHFARRLLMPTHLLPIGWQQRTDESLAQLFDVPPHVVRARRLELTRA